MGIVPDITLAEAAGIEIDNGIKTDTQGRTSAANIWAAGDCASFPYQGTRIRLESVPNAIDQAEVVAENIMGAGKEYVAKPWFWSDQFDVKLQIAGLNTGYDDVVTRRGNKKPDDLVLVLQWRPVVGGRRNERPARIHDWQTYYRSQ